MLYDLSWLEPGKMFPPSEEKLRLERYASNLRIFKNEQYAVAQEYQPYLERIETVVSNVGEYINFPVLFNYQKLMSVKMADLVCGERPVITGKSEEENETVTTIREDINFDSKLYATVIDISRYGDAIWRVYKTKEKNTFVCWEPTQWFPIVSADGTKTITQHVLCWTVNVGTEAKPDFRLHVQIHHEGFYNYRVFKLDSFKGIIEREEEEPKKITTGIKGFAVMNLRAFETSDTIYGSDDYDTVDSILAEVMVRVAQISSILDKHADPSLTGPASMLKQDPATGRMFLETGKFYAVSAGEEQPKYLVWEGELEAAFKQVELLINQLYILSEMGSALVGAAAGGSQAVSGTAMRFKMVSPLAKARRIANNLALQVRQLFSLVSQIGYTTVERKNISVEWADGLPDDPRENIEMVKLATGAKHIMPLELAIVEYFKRTNTEAQRWMKMIKEQDIGEDEEEKDDDDPTKVNPLKKGSDTGLTAFHGMTNK